MKIFESLHVENEAVGGLEYTRLQFRSILIATDYSPASAVAARLAAQLAKGYNSRLFLLRAIRPEHYAVNLRGLAELRVVNLQAAREKLTRISREIPEVGTLNHQEIVAISSPGNAIRKAVELNEIDLLVLGSQRLPKESVAEWSLRRLGCSILMVGPAFATNMLPPRSVVLAVDLTSGSLRPGQIASSLAHGFDGKLTVLHVLPEVAEIRNTLFIESVQRKLEQLLPSGFAGLPTLHFEVRYGNFASIIAQSAKENKANRIVVGIRYRAPFADHVPGIKLSSVIDEARCPVLPIPLPSDE